MGLVGYENFVFSAPNPNSGIRARLCVDVWYGKNTSSMWASILQLLPSHVYSFRVAAMFDEAAPDRPYAYAYARLVPRLTYGLYRIKWVGVSVSLL